MSDWTKQNQAVARLRLIADQDHTETSRTKRLDADACRVAADYVVSLEAQRDAAFLAGVRAGLERAVLECVERRELNVDVEGPALELAYASARAQEANECGYAIGAIDPATVEAGKGDK